MKKILKLDNREFHYDEFHVLRINIPHHLDVYLRDNIAFTDTVLLTIDTNTLTKEEKYSIYYYCYYQDRETKTDHATKWFINYFYIIDLPPEHRFMEL